MPFNEAGTLGTVCVSNTHELLEFVSQVRPSGSRSVLV